MSDPKKIKVKRTREGLISIKDPVTGEQFIQKNKKAEKAALKEKSYDLPPEAIHQVMGPNGDMVWVQKGVNPDNLPTKVWPYSKTLADHICYLVTEGMTIKDICKQAGFPPVNIVYNWSRTHDEFKESLSQSRKDRAHFFHDVALEEAFKPQYKDQVPAAALRVKTLQWAAEVGAPESYSPKQIIEGNPDKPIRILVDTGISRTPIEIKSEVIDVESRGGSIPNGQTQLRSSNDEEVCPTQEDNRENPPGSG